jgi:protein SCO1/2
LNLKLIFFLFFLSFFILGTTHAHQHHTTQLEEVPKPVLGESVYNLNSQWMTQNEKVVRFSTFQSHIVVLAMIYTSCTEACPLIVSSMQRIEHGLSAKARERVQFVLISFDPETDTPTKLKEYAKAHGLDLTRWTLLNGTQSLIREFSAILDVRYKKIKKAEFTHSNIITVLDSDGVVKYQQVGLNEDPETSIDIIEKMTKKTTHGHSPKE